MGEREIQVDALQGRRKVPLRIAVATRLSVNYESIRFRTNLDRLRRLEITLNDGVALIKRDELVLHLDLAHEFIRRERRRPSISDPHLLFGQRQVQRARGKRLHPVDGEALPLQISRPLELHALYVPQRIRNECQATRRRDRHSGHVNRSDDLLWSHRQDALGKVQNPVNRPLFASINNHLNLRFIPLVWVYIPTQRDLFFARRGNR